MLWRAVWARLMGRPESMDEIRMTPQQAIDAYQASLPDVPVYAACIGPVRTEEERQALVDRINEALAAAHEPDAVTDLRAVPFDTPRPVEVCGASVADDARNMQGKVDSFESWLGRVLPTCPQPNPQGGIAMDTSHILTGVKTLYGGSDVNELNNAVTQAAAADPGCAFLVLEVSGATAKVTKAIVDAEHLVASLKGVNLTSFQGITTILAGAGQLQADLR